MTKKGVIPFTLPTTGAKIAGQLIAVRANQVALLDTPLRELPSAGKKLLNAVRRVKGKKRKISLWSLTRQETLCLSAYLMLYLHPENANKNLLTADEREHIRKVVLALVPPLTRKPGRKRQSMNDAKYVVETFEQEKAGTLPNHVQPPDPTYARRMKERLDWQHALEQQEFVQISPYLQALTAKRYR